MKHEANFTGKKSYNLDHEILSFRQITTFIPTLALETMSLKLALESSTSFEMGNILFPLNYLLHFWLLHYESTLGVKLVHFLVVHCGLSVEINCRFNTAHVIY